MRRADRLFQIVQLLRGGRLVTAAKLAERLEVSERTIYRDIVDLQSTGVPIDGEAGIGYVMRSGFDLPPLMFTRDEIVALVTGARMVRAWGGVGMARAAEEALIKIETVIPDEDRDRIGNAKVFAPQMDMTDELRQLIDRLESAIENRQTLSFQYRDKEDAVTTRRVRPLGLWFWGKVWTLVSWCELRNDFRMFRIDRLTHVTDDGTSFRNEPDKSLAACLRQLEAKYGPQY